VNQKKKREEQKVKENKLSERMKEITKKGGTREEIKGTGHGVCYGRVYGFRCQYWRKSGKVNLSRKEGRG